LQGVVALYDVVLERKRACLLLERCEGGTLLSLVQGRVNDSKARIARERRAASAGAGNVAVVVNLFGAPREPPPPYCLSEAEARAGLRAAAEALRYVHDKGFVHRDVKLENLLMAAPLNLATLKLADFGFATLAARPGAGAGRAPDKGLQGTVEYAAPEILAAYRGRGKNSTAAADAEAAVRLQKRAARAQRAAR
jgi:serine/threonine protein kinase